MWLEWKKSCWIYYWAIGVDLDVILKAFLQSITKYKLKITKKIDAELFDTVIKFYKWSQQKKRDFVLNNLKIQYAPKNALL